MSTPSIPTLPPKVRAITYWVLAPLNVVIGALVAQGSVDKVYLVIVAGLSGLIGFPLAGTNVNPK